MGRCGDITGTLAATVIAVVSFSFCEEVPAQLESLAAFEAIIAYHCASASVVNFLIAEADSETLAEAAEVADAAVTPFLPKRP